MEYHAVLRADAATATVDVGVRVDTEVLVDIADLADVHWTATAWHHSGAPFASMADGPRRVVTVELRSSGRVGWCATAELRAPPAEPGIPAKSLSQAVLVGVTAFAPPAEASP